MPIANTMSAYGILGYANVGNRNRAAARAHRKLSPHHGPVQVNGAISVVPALIQRERPAPTWMPLTTGTGVTLFAHLIRPVMLKIPTRAATTRPAAAFSSIVNFRAIAIEAIAFIGCTGKGIPNATPVKTFAAPVKSKVDGSDIDPVKTSAVMRGRRVPKSPREPDNSERGEDLSTSPLYL